jgi:hypothetical protein
LNPLLPNILFVGECVTFRCVANRYTEAAEISVCSLRNAACRALIASDESLLKAASSLDSLDFEREDLLKLLNFANDRRSDEVADVEVDEGSGDSFGGSLGGMYP